jgi:hypothetical protein
MKRPSWRGPVSADQRNARLLNADHNARAATARAAVAVSRGAWNKAAGADGPEANRMSTAIGMSKERSGSR